MEKTNKLFTAEPNVAYSGGCIIVSAQDIVEAEEILKNEVKNNSWFDFCRVEFTCLKELPNSFHYGESGIISDFVYIE